MNKYGKFIVHSFILFVLLFSVAAISAADLNGTADNGMDVLKDSGTADSSFFYLSYEVENADSSLDFDNDYKYNDSTDGSYVNGVLLDKNNFVINGNNHVIDCGNNARAFNITGNSVVINNLIIKNAKYPSGSAISTKSNLTLNNVTFINCSGNVTDDKGAIFAREVMLNVNNCKFIDNSGGEGASITAYGGSVEVVNSTFSSSSDNIIWGQIYLYKSNLSLLNSTFLNTTSRYATAVFAEDECRIVISQSKFKNLFASNTAGAIGVKHSYALLVTGCEFYNVSSSNNGGAIFADINGQQKAQDGTVMLINTTFEECRSGFGGAILQLAGDLIVNGSKFTNNSAEFEGGAIYTSYANVEITDSKFRNNTLSDELSYGGACYFDMGVVTVVENIFENNLGLNVSTIFAYDVDLTLERNYFENPSNVTSIYTVYGTVEVIRNDFTDDVCSFNNTNYFYNFENSANPFIIVNNTSLSFDEIPDKFDLRDYNWVTPVKNQGFMGACWAFGNLAALESSLLRYTNVTYSLSVNNMQNSMLQYSKYGRVTAVEGGRYYSAIAYLIDWLGVFPEEYDGYDELGKISSLYINPDDLHITNAVVIPARKNAEDNDLIKNALIKYGAVATSHYADFDEEKYFNPVYSAQYYNGKEDTNHLVCIVGWDDNYSRGNFNPLNRPEHDGAWIVKNSWGTDWGDEGYFYVSYYDTSIATVPSVAYIINNDTYCRIYQNEVGGIGDWASDVKYYANKFVADENELIAAVGTFFEEAGSEYELMVAVNGVDVYSQKGVSKFGGYETIELDKHVQIKKGDNFTVGFKNKMFFAELLRIHIQKNQSFASADGKVWMDLANSDVVAIVKAYTVSDINITENLVKYYGDETPFVAHVGANETVIFEFNGENHTVVADENGLAKLEIDCDIGEYPITTTYNNISIVNYVAVKSTIISSDVTRGYNSNYNYKVQVLDASGNPLNNANVVISINGKFSSYTSDNSGYITIQFKKLTKQQTIIVVNPKTGDNRQTKIVVKSRFSGASNVAMYYFDGSKFKARIVGDDGKFVGKNQVVTIKLNKKTYKVKTDAKGYATFKIPSTVKPGSYKLTATYKGQTIKKTIKVKQNLKTRKYTVKKSAKKLVVKATLKNGKAPLKSKKITLKINGKKITAKTNKKGIAKFTIKKNVIKKLRAGKKYTLKLTYLKNTVKTTLKVKR